VSERLSDFDGPALNRHRALELARAQEQLRQARDLAQSATARLVDLFTHHDLDLKAELKLANDARKSCDDAVSRLDDQLERIPVL
jgi:hypothetical protein